MAIVLFVNGDEEDQQSFDRLVQLSRAIELPNNLDYCGCNTFQFFENARNEELSSVINVLKQLRDVNPVLKVLSTHTSKIILVVCRASELTDNEMDDILSLSHVLRTVVFWTCNQDKRLSPLALKKYPNTMCVNYSARLFVDIIPFLDMDGLNEF